jgi:hypothetical protein
MAKSVEELLKSQDPLSEEAMRAVLRAREENGFVDFKLDFDPVGDREWLEITKDVMAFANTAGGYLVFGVRNATYEIVGLKDEIARVLSDPNNLMQKLNRHVEPHFSALRSKAAQIDGKTCVVIFIPPSLGQTHVVSKDASFVQQSGAPKFVLRQGTFYVRRSGANHLADARDLDGVVMRGLEHFRSTLMEKIARVVESPVETEVLVVKQEGQEGTERKFVIKDAPDAIAVKGMTFSVTPETPEQEIAAWIAMTAGDPEALPSAGTVWKWYRDRRTLNLAPQQRARVAAYSLMRCVPAFYWLQGCSEDEMKEALKDVIERRPSLETVGNTLATSAFLGRKFYNSQVARLGGYATRLDRKQREYPQEGPRAYFEAIFVPKRGKGGKVVRADLEAELDDIAKSALKYPDKVPARADGYQALRLDSYLYAQDSYAPKPEQKDQGKQPQL